MFTHAASFMASTAADTIRGWPCPMFTTEYMLSYERVSCLPKSRTVEPNIKYEVQVLLPINIPNSSILGPDDGDLLTMSAIYDSQLTSIRPEEVQIRQQHVLGSH